MNTLTAPVPPSHTVAQASSTVASAVRAAAVTFGPSVALSALLVASLATTITSLVARPKHIARRLRLAAGLGSLLPLVYVWLARPRVLRWGATQQEATRELPGDEIVPHPVWTSTRAIAIDAPAEAVWPWLVQMGQDRGGLYSYTWLENLAGLDFHNADRIVPEWQHLSVGDPVRFAPGQDTMRVARLVPGRTLVWRIATRSGGQESDPFAATWAFVLEPVDAARTRLIQRFRFAARPRRWAGLGYIILIEIPHFVMEVGMLRGIKQRAEGSWSQRARPEQRVAGRARPRSPSQQHR